MRYLTLIGTALIIMMIIKGLFKLFSLMVVLYFLGGLLTGYLLGSLIIRIGVLFYYWHKSKQ
jgi:hypothetical protein